MEEKFLLIAARAEELAVLGSWVKVYKATLAPDGMISSLSAEEQDEFRKSREYTVVQQIIADLRKIGNHEGPTAVLTIRVPTSVHDALRQESHGCFTSMNQLCISKLLQSIDPNLVPRDIRSHHAAGRAEI